MTRKYWFPAIVCPMTIEDAERYVKMRSPIIACPKCKHYGDTNIDKTGTFIRCDYQSSNTSVKRDGK